MIGAFLMLATLPVVASDEKPIDCGSCAAWNAPHAPFKLHGNSYYVGTEGLSAVLITTPKGHFLIDGGLPQSATVIAGNIKALGFDIKDVKWLLSSHAHFDHAGGLAALQRMSGAPVLAAAKSAEGLRSGRASLEDPQYAPDNTMPFPAIGNVRTVNDRQEITLADVRVTAHYTPGHAPGGNSWSWKSCEAGKCITIVFADSLNPVSEPDYRYSAHPEYLAAFRASIAKVRSLDCDILVSAHPDVSQVLERAAAGTLVNAKACTIYADQAEQRLRSRLDKEAAGD
jgi:metallo-beta-lactamase class B